MNAAAKFCTVQQEVANLLSGRKLIGHALHNDLKVRLLFILFLLLLFWQFPKRYKSSGWLSLQVACFGNPVCCVFTVWLLLMCRCYYLVIRGKIRGIVFISGDSGGTSLSETLVSYVFRFSSCSILMDRYIHVVTWGSRKVCSVWLHNIWG